MTIDPFTMLVNAGGWAAAGGMVVWTLIMGGLKSYMAEKFKNIAGKEDVAILTRAVQAVELEFSSAFARLQSDLELVRGH